MPQDPMIHAPAAGMYPGGLGCSELPSKVRVRILRDIREFGESYCNARDSY